MREWKLVVIVSSPAGGLECLTEHDGCLMAYFTPRVFHPRAQRHLGGGGGCRVAHSQVWDDVCNVITHWLHQCEKHHPAQLTLKLREKLSFKNPEGGSFNQSLTHSSGVVSAKHEFINLNCRTKRRLLCCWGNHGNNDDALDNNSFWQHSTRALDALFYLHIIIFFFYIPAQALKHNKKKLIWL